MLVTSHLECCVGLVRVEPSGLKRHTDLNRIVLSFLRRDSLANSPQGDAPQCWYAFVEKPVLVSASCRIDPWRCLLAVDTLLSHWKY